MFAALGDRTRLHLVARLSDEGPMSVVRLTKGAGITRQAVSKHLKALEDADLVHSHRTGRERIWALRSDRLTEARQHLEAISAQWDEALDRLKGFVESNRH